MKKSKSKKRKDYSPPPKKSKSLPYSEYSFTYKSNLENFDFLSLENNREEEVCISKGSFPPPDLKSINKLREVRKAKKSNIRYKKGWTKNDELHYRWKIKLLLNKKFRYRWGKIKELTGTNYLKFQGTGIYIEENRLLVSNEDLVKFLLIASFPTSLKNIIPGFISRPPFLRVLAFFQKLLHPWGVTGIEDGIPIHRSFSKLSTFQTQIWAKCSACDHFIFEYVDQKEITKQKNRRLLHESTKYCPYCFSIKEGLAEKTPRLFLELPENINRQDFINLWPEIEGQLKKIFKERKDRPRISSDDIFDRDLDWYLMREQKITYAKISEGYVGANEISVRRAVERFESEIDKM